MASSANAVYCAIVATAFWSFIGFAVGRHLLPRTLAAGAAPVIGWAVHSAVTLPIFMLVGFSFPAVSFVAVLFICGAAAALFARNETSETGQAAIPWWALVGAAALALVPAAAIAPKISADAVQLASPIFDHSKIAMIDAMVRQGVPPVNPFFGENGEPGRLVYYYLWYFGAAQAARVLGVSGWEADIGLTWFAAFSSLTLMMGLAVWASRRASAAIWVVLLAFATSLRDTFALLFAQEHIDAVLVPATGFAGWLFQAAWVPQHLTAASCVVAAVIVMSQIAERQTVARFVILVLMIVAGFECSTYVGGMTFAVAALIIVPLLSIRVEPANRARFALGLMTAGVVALCLAAPFILAQIAAVGQRGAGAPIYLDHFEVLSNAASSLFLRLLDLPAYWLILLPIEFPAVSIAGAIALIVLLRTPRQAGDRATLVALVGLAVAGLAVSWLVVVDVGGNNDLRMRAVLPSAMILIAGAAAGVVLRPRRLVIAAAAIGGLVLSLPNSVEMVRYNFVGDATADAKVFAQTPELWAAVRRHVAPDKRVGNNPLFLKDMTPWAVNISWAVLADRSSCFAAHDLVLAYVAMPRARREAINAQFVRVFEGNGKAEDISDLATRYGCEVVIVTAQDKAWDSDPFEASALYARVESREGQWRIYKRKDEASPRPDRQ